MEEELWQISFLIHLSTGIFLVWCVTNQVRQLLTFISKQSESLHEVDEGCQWSWKA